ncbi:MAG: hypothetical protein LH702_13255, partial [Phormidesmis sp. CAN_BIN44]|nr:hypothetical protein [Phormidesmis sp. CAN_BIN44]
MTQSSSTRVISDADAAGSEELRDNSGFWSSLLQQLLNRQSLSQEQAAALMHGWLTDAIPPALSGALLIAL